MTLVPAYDGRWIPLDGLKPGTDEIVVDARRRGGGRIDVQDWTVSSG